MLIVCDLKLAFVGSNFILNLIIISSIVSLYLCGLICKGWVWEIGEESSFIDESLQFVTSSWEAREKSNPWKGHVWSTWLEAEESR